MNYHSHNGKQIVRTKLPTSFFILKVKYSIVIYVFETMYFLLKWLYCKNNLPSFTSRIIQDCQAFPKVVEIFNSAKIVGNNYKKQKLYLNFLILKWFSNNHITIILHLWEIKSYPNTLTYVFLNWSAMSKSSKAFIALFQRVMEVPSARSLSDCSRTTALSPTLFQ